MEVPGAHGGTSQLSTGIECLSAWRQHFRNAARSATSAGVHYSVPFRGEVEASVQLLRIRSLGQADMLDTPFVEADLLSALHDACAGHAPGTDGLPYDPFLVDDAVFPCVLKIR